MSEGLCLNISVIVKQKGGSLDEANRSEFKRLCQQDFNYSPDMSCGKCIYKHAVKLHSKYEIK